MSTIAARFAKFASVGVLATVVHAAVLAAAIEIGHVDPVLATALAFSVAVLVGFALNRRWTFADHGGAQAQLWRYVVAALAGLADNMAIMYVTVDLLHWSPYVGFALAVVLMPPLTFALNRAWVFRHRP
jgi:putative flippase GtrA